jgi:hypothetical protein
LLDQIINVKDTFLSNQSAFVQMTAAYYGVAPPAVQTAFDQSVSDRFLGTVDAAVRIWLANLVTSVGGPTYNPANRESAATTVGYVFQSELALLPLAGALDKGLASGSMARALGGASKALGEDGVVAAGSDVAETNKLAQVISDCENPLGTCFTAGTPIETARGRVAIESLQLGQRTLTQSTADGGCQASYTSVDPSTWKRVRLRMFSPKGFDTIDIDLLRPPTWVYRNQVVAGANVYLSAQELGLEARAHVLAVEACPQIDDGPGGVVTATVTHLNAEVMEIKLAGLDNLLEPTAPHHFYSEDRGVWTAADSLQPGELLRTMDSAPAVVEWVRRKPGVHRVYNIEIEHEHQYFVSTLAVLVHNAGVTVCGGGHYAEWELHGPRNGFIGEGDEISGIDVRLETPPDYRLTFPEQSWYGHTERKIISDLINRDLLTPGRTLTIKGTLPPCSNCRSLMKWASETFRIRVLYRDAEFAQTAWSNRIRIL